MRPSPLSALLAYRGHTLIELLVVMLIIALGTALMTLSLGETADARARRDARALGGFFNRVADEAAARGRTLRVVLREGQLLLEALPDATDPPPALDAPRLTARLLDLDIAGHTAVEPALLFPPGGGGAFRLELEHHGQRFHIERDSLSRIRVRAAT